jgi:hypothetical protein
VRIIPSIEIKGRGTLINATRQEALDAGAAQADVDAALIAADMRELRGRRNDLLAASEWTLGNDSPFKPAQKDAWAVYRQALRDLPAALKKAGVSPADALTDLAHWPIAPQN